MGEHPTSEPRQFTQVEIAGSHPLPARSPDLDKAVEAVWYDLGLALVAHDLWPGGHLLSEADKDKLRALTRQTIEAALPLLPSPEQDSRAEYIVQLEEAVERATRLAERYGTAIERISEALPHVTKVRLIIAGLAAGEEEVSP